MIQVKKPTCAVSAGGIRLHVLTEQRFKAARISVFFVLPADKRSSPLRTLLFGVLRRGSEAYPRLALLNRRLDELYGTTLTIRNLLQGDDQVLSFTAEMLEDVYVPASDAPRADILDGTVEILSQLVLHPLTDADGRLRAEAVEQEKVALADNIRADKNDTRTYAANRLRQIMCEDEPYGIPLAGTVEDVECMTPESVTDAWHELLREARCEVFYTGQANADAVRERWDRHFGAAMAPVGGVSLTVTHPIPATPRYVEESLAVSQGKLCMGFATGEIPHDERDLSVALVCNELLGVMQSSLLFRYVREELGLCYYCDSSLDARKGVLMVASGIRSDRRDEAERAINACISRIARDEITDEDVTLAKLSLGNYYRQIPDSAAAMEAFWFGQIMRDSNKTPDACLGEILSVTREEVVAFAARLVPDTVFFLCGEGEEDDEEVYDDE